MEQSFTVDGALGAFTLGSELEFDTDRRRRSTPWKVTGGLSLAGVTFDAMFVLTADYSPQTASTTRMTRRSF